MKAICTNLKTYRSFDLSTNCPRRQAGNPCSYCYVESARNGGARAKKVIDRINYNNEVLKLKQPTIDKLNLCGGLRMFSFGDYMQWMDEDIHTLVQDARQRGLMLKAITKQTEFVDKFHSYIDIINLSTDALGEGVAYNIARQYRDKYSNVKVRCAIMHPSDIKTLSWTDIYTFNHSNNGYYKFSKKDIAKYSSRYPNKVCCTESNCISCNIKCGINI